MATVPLVGFGQTPTLIALFAYGLLPIFENALAGFESCPRTVLEAGPEMVGQLLADGQAQSVAVGLCRTAGDEEGFADLLGKPGALVEDPAHDGVLGLGGDGELDGGAAA